MSRLRGRPGSALWLMGNELRLFWRRGRMGPKTGLILVAVLVVGWSALSFLLLHAIGPRIPPPPVPATPLGGLILAGVSMAIAFVLSVMVSQAMLAAVEAIYTRNDLDLLLSSPLSPWTALVVRSAAIALGALPLYAGFLGPPVLWLAVFSSPLWFAAGPGLVALAFAATGVALLVVTGLFRALGPKRTRVVAQILSALAGAAAFLTFQLPNLLGSGETESSQRRAAAWLMRQRIDPHAPWLLPARAMTGDWGALAILVIVSIAVFALGVFLFSRRFVADAAAASVMGQTRRTTDGRVATLRGGQIASIVRKELRLLQRDPVLLSQVGLQIFYLVPLIFVVVRVGEQASALRVQAVAPGLTLIAGWLASSLIWITVSAEDAPDLIASGPVDPRLLDRGKLIAAIAPVATVMALPLGVLAARAPGVALWAGLGVTVSLLFSGFIGLWRRTTGSRRSFLRRRAQGSIIANLGQTLVMLGLSGTIGLGVYGYPWLALVAGLVTTAIFGALYKPRSEQL